MLGIYLYIPVSCSVKITIDKLNILLIKEVFDISELNKEQ